MRGLLALILAVAAPHQSPTLPAADAPLPREPAKLAAAFTETTRRLRATSWDGTGAAIPDDVTYLALHHQRILRRMAEQRTLGDATLAELPNAVKGEARDTVRARRLIDSIPRGKAPKVRVADAAPAADLRAHYADAQRRFGIHDPVQRQVPIHHVEAHQATTGSGARTSGGAYGRRSRGDDPQGAQGDEAQSD